MKSLFILWPFASIITIVQCIPQPQPISTIVNTGSSAVARSEDVGSFINYVQKYLNVCVEFFFRAMVIMHSVIMKIMQPVAVFEKKKVHPVFKLVHMVYVLLMAVCVSLTMWQM